MPVSLVLADDHPLVLEGLDALLRREPDLEIRARCSRAADVAPAVRTHRPDVVVLDVRMPEMDGLAVMRELRREGLTTRAVLLTGEMDEHEALEAFRLDVAGIVLKEMAPRLLVQAIRKVHAGERWLEQRSAGRSLDLLLRREETERKLAGVLTVREREVARAVAMGLRNKEVAAKLHITEGTVKIHLHAIYEKLGLGSRVELSRFLANGAVNPDTAGTDRIPRTSIGG